MMQAMMVITIVMIMVMPMKVIMMMLVMEVTTVMFVLMILALLLKFATFICHSLYLASPVMDAANAVAIRAWGESEHFHSKKIKSANEFDALRRGATRTSCRASTYRTHVRRRHVTRGCARTTARVALVEEEAG